MHLIKKLRNSKKGKILRASAGGSHMYSQLHRRHSSGGSQFEASLWQIVCETLSGK
jgi:hypothetical protein